MSEALKYQWHVCDPAIAGMAERVCEATRRAAIDSVTSAVSSAADRTPQTPDLVREVANRALARATVMQHEIDRFLAATHRRDTRVVG